MRRCAAARVMRPARQARSCSRHAHTQLRVSRSARAKFVEPRHLPCASSHCGKCGARGGEFFAPRRSRRLRFADSTSVILRALAGGVQSPRTSTSSERAMCSSRMPPLLPWSRCCFSPAWLSFDSICLGSHVYLEYGITGSPSFPPPTLGTSLFRIRV